MAVTFDANTSPPTYCLPLFYLLIVIIIIIALISALLQMTEVTLYVRLNIITMNILILNEAHQPSSQVGYDLKRNQPRQAMQIAAKLTISFP